MGELGCVGHVRADFGPDGNEFWHSWWPHKNDRLNTQRFKEELTDVINSLRADDPLKDRTGMEIISLILICGGMLILLAAASYFSGNTSLDGIRSKPVGDGQHGKARFATKSEIQQTYKHIPYELAKWYAKQNLPDAAGLVWRSIQRSRQCPRLFPR